MGELEARDFELENDVNRIQKAIEKFGTIHVKKNPDLASAKRWENHAFHYAKCEYGSEAFDRELEEGYDEFGSLTKTTWLHEETKARPIKLRRVALG